MEKKRGLKSNEEDNAEVSQSLEPSYTSQTPSKSRISKLRKMTVSPQQKAIWGMQPGSTGAYISCDSHPKKLF